MANENIQKMTDRERGTGYWLQHPHQITILSQLFDLCLELMYLHPTQFTRCIVECILTILQLTSTDRKQ